MKIEIKKTISLKYTANDYELFFDMDGREEVAAQINRALEEAINSGADSGEAYKAAFAVCKANSKFGACDSEPLRLVEYVLEKIFDE